MNIDVRFRHIPATDKTREFAIRRTTFALDRFEDKIEQIMVRLTDINGPHGGPTKRCSVHITLTDGHEVVVNHEHAHIEGAIAEGTTATKRAVRRYLDKARSGRQRAA